MEGNEFRLLIDGGNFSGQRSQRDIEKGVSMLRGMELMGYDVVNIGDRELYQGLGNFRNMMNKSPLKFISANLYDKESGEPLADRYAIFEINGLKVGVTGFLDDLTKLGPEYREDLERIEVKDPIESLTEVMEKLTDDSDLQIVLSRYHVPQTKELAIQLEGIDVMVVCQSTSPSKDLYEEGGVVIIQPGRKGQYIGAVTLDITPDRTIGSYVGGAVLLDNQVPSDPKMAEFVVSCKDGIQKADSEERARKELLRARGELEKKGEVFLGVEVCARCHTDQHNQWLGTHHADALQTLKDKGELNNTDCLKCHTTGYGGTGGYVSVDTDPDLGDVQCEACHGIGKNHVRDGSYAMVEKDKCLSCHDEKNSPDFDYESYLTKVVH
jgi:hypothetical protein